MELEDVRVISPFLGGGFRGRGIGMAYGTDAGTWVVVMIDNVTLDRQDQPPQGGGEPAIICMGGALANAIYDACGARLFQMPMTPERVLEGINKVKGEFT